MLNKQQSVLIRKQTGFSLIEILVTMVILATGLLSIVGLQTSNVKNTHNAFLQTQARYIATTLMNKVRMNPAGLTSYLVDGSTYACPSTPPSPACYASVTGTTACTAAQLATSDTYHSICGYQSGTQTTGGVKNLLPSGALSLECIAADGTFGTDCSQNDIVITIGWGDRNILEGATQTEQRSIQVTGSL